MTLPDPALSRAVLIGTSRYTGLDPLPAVANNLHGLRDVLTDRELWGLSRAHCRCVRDPTSADELLNPVEAAAGEATDTLLVYYAGHGRTYEDSSGVYLTLVGSDSRRARTAVPYDWLRAELLKTRAARRVVILDCCFSGRAVGSMGGTLADLVVTEGAYVLTATPANALALAPAGRKYTAFTAELLDILRNGIPGGPPLLDLETLYRHVHARMLASGGPEPQAREHNTAGALALARNRAWRRPEAEPPPAPVVERSQPAGAAGGGDRHGLMLRVGIVLGVLLTVLAFVLLSWSRMGMNAVDYRAGDRPADVQEPGACASTMCVAGIEHWDWRLPGGGQVTTTVSVLQPEAARSLAGELVLTSARDCAGATAAWTVTAGGGTVDSGTLRGGPRAPGHPLTGRLPHSPHTFVIRARRTDTQPCAATLQWVQPHVHNHWTWLF